ncbi:hypothetical protein R3P38DRAFT_2606375 [Favolaschia claudopus]|uniref:Uncharacterized protein n=1 Tax=Favolaschia claudopus TaxID=2862362 RepID=A0AAW0DC55_9AGAR
MPVSVLRQSMRGCAGVCLRQSLSIQLSTAISLYVHNIGIGHAFSFPSGTLMPVSVLRQSMRGCVAMLRWVHVLLRERLGSLRPFSALLRLAIIRVQKICMIFTTPRSYDVNGRDRLSGYSAHGLNYEALCSGQTGHTDDWRRDAITPELSSTQAGYATASTSTVGRAPNSNLSVTPKSTVSGHSLQPLRFLDVRPIFPEDFRRYHRVTIPRALDRIPCEIQPRTLQPVRKAPPAGWTSRLHPEGAVYFHHEQRRIFTDIDVRDEKKLSSVIEVADRVDGVLRAATPSVNREKDARRLDLVVDELEAVDEAGDPVAWGYYLVNHFDRYPFWVHSVEAGDLWVCRDITGSIESEQLEHAMACQYFQHCAMFPDTLDLTLSHINEIQDYLVYCLADQTTSSASTVSVSVETLTSWLSIAKQLGCAHDTTADTSPSFADAGDGQGSTYFYARVMANFAQDRFLNFHGLPCARLSVDQSIYDDQNPHPSWLFHLICPLLFYAPREYLQFLDKAYTDKLVLSRIWKSLIEKLNKEWEEFTLLAIVVLNANVGFLSIQSVDTLGGIKGRSAVQIFSYLSILASIGSIILGLLLVRQNRTIFHESAFDISASVTRRSSKRFGLELPALIFALPYALLVWAIIFFTSAFIVACLRIQENVVARSTVGSAVALLVLLIIWCIWDAWDKHAAYHESWWSRIETDLQSVWRRVRPTIVSPLDWRCTRSAMNFFRKNVAGADIRMTAVGIAQP